MSSQQLQPNLLTDPYMIHAPKYPTLEAAVEAVVSHRLKSNFSSTVEVENELSFWRLHLHETYPDVDFLATQIHPEDPAISEEERWGFYGKKWTVVTQIIHALEELVAVNVFPPNVERLKWTYGVWDNLDREIIGKQFSKQQARDNILKTGAAAPESTTMNTTIDPAANESVSRAHDSEVESTLARRDPQDEESDSESSNIASRRQVRVDDTSTDKQRSEATTNKDAVMKDQELDAPASLSTEKHYTSEKSVSNDSGLEASFRPSTAFAEVHNIKKQVRRAQPAVDNSDSELDAFPSLLTKHNDDPNTKKKRARDAVDETSQKTSTDKQRTETVIDEDTVMKDSELDATPSTDKQRTEASTGEDTDSELDAPSTSGNDAHNIKKRAQQPAIDNHRIRRKWLADPDDVPDDSPTSTTRSYLQSKTSKACRGRKERSSLSPSIQAQEKSYAGSWLTPAPEQLESRLIIESVGVAVVSSRSGTPQSSEQTAAVDRNLGDTALPFASLPSPKSPAPPTTDEDRFWEFKRSHRNMWDQDIIRHLNLYDEGDEDYEGVEPEPVALVAHRRNRWDIVR